MTDDNNGWNTESTPQGQRRSTKSGRKFGKVLYSEGFIAQPTAERATQPMYAADADSTARRQTDPRLSVGQRDN